MRKCYRLIGRLLIAVVLQGCVGIGIIGSERNERELSDVFMGVDQPISTLVVMDKWGQPDKVDVRSDGSEFWTYEHGVRWGGLAICVVIPIPLILPIGHESTSLSVRDGFVVSASRLRETTNLYVAGIVPGMCYDMGIGVFHR